MTKRNGNKAPTNCFDTFDSVAHGSHVPRVQEPSPDFAMGSDPYDPFGVYVDPSSPNLPINQLNAAIDDDRLWEEYAATHPLVDEPQF